MQKSVVKEIDLRYKKDELLYFHVPNGEKRDPVTASILAAMGTLSGVSDLLFLEPSPAWAFNGLCIELKTKGGRITPEQEAFLIAARNRGFACWVCWSIPAVIEVLEFYFADIKKR